MSGLLTSLGAAAASLNAQSQAIAVVTNNISNVNNPNYSEETPTFSDLGMVQTADGPESLGLTVSVSQQRSAVLDQMVRQEASLTSGFTAQQSLLQQAQAALGENITSSTSSASSASTATETGLSASIDAFFNSFENLAANPTDQGAKETVVEQAGVLTDRFQQIDQNLAQVQSNADSQATSGVTSANTLLQGIATLNSQIASFEAGDPGSAVDLRDQREGDLEQLAALMPITVTENAQGEDTVTAPAAGSGSVTLVANGTVSNPLSYSAGVFSAGSTALGLASGSLAGTVAASAGAVQSLRTGLDALASQIVTAVNTAYNPSATNGGNFFNSSGTTAGTIALDGNLTSANLQAGSGSAGDNSIATAVANVANQTFATSGGDAIDGTIDQFYSTAASNIGQALDTANTQVTDQTNVQTIITNQRNSVSGVSLDQEMSHLMTYQTAYQASSELFSTVNAMLTELITDLTSAP
jgi:flagellar hook-associated protein 1 FlgK